MDRKSSSHFLNKSTRERKKDGKENKLLSIYDTKNQATIARGKNTLDDGGNRAYASHSVYTRTSWDTWNSCLYVCMYVEEVQIPQSQSQQEKERKRERKKGRKKCPSP